MSELLILPILNRLDRVSRKLDELIEKIAAITPTPITVTPAPVEVITEPKLNNRYKVITVSLVVALTDSPIGIKELKPTTGFATYMTVLAVGGGFTYKLNSTGGDSVTASVGEEVADFEIAEIYLSCGAVGGNAIFWVEYRVEE